MPPAGLPPFELELMLALSDESPLLVELFFLQFALALLEVQLELLQALLILPLELLLASVSFL